MFVITVPNFLSNSYLFFSDRHDGILYRVFSLGATVYLDHVQPRGGGTYIWPGSHR